MLFLLKHFSEVAKDVRIDKRVHLLNYCALICGIVFFEIWSMQSFIVSEVRIGRLDKR